MKRAWVLHPEVDGQPAARDPQLRLAEAVRLAEALRLAVPVADCIRVRRPRPATLFGAGTVRTLGARLATAGVELVIIDGPLSPIQQRNLEREWQVKILDRSGLILEIFGDRAQTAEGRVQVEHAHLTYQKSRLVRSWTHLERQRGGFGFLGGPGETQIEADRRALDTRLRAVDKELQRIAQNRRTQRRGRQRQQVPSLALVGYTNAGKSTLFNRLTAGEVLERDMLFSTLDPTVRMIRLPAGLHVSLSDTVGFIADLPPELIAAFRATLAEVTDAALILHVMDASSEELAEQKHEVEVTLAALEASAPVLEVHNKVDLLTSRARAALHEKLAQRPGAVCVSARSGAGVPELLERIQATLEDRGDHFVARLDVTAGAALAWLHRHGMIRSSAEADGELVVDAWLSKRDRQRFRQKFHSEVHSIEDRP